MDEERRASLSSLAEKIIDLAALTGSVDVNGINVCIAPDGSDTLVISCSGVVPGRLIYALENTSQHIETHKIFICDVSNTWYYAGIKGLTESFRETVYLIEQLVCRIHHSKSRAIGTSGGGYMALMLAAHLNLDRVLALSPQTTVNPKHLKAINDGRWSDSMYRISQICTDPNDVRAVWPKGPRPRWALVVYPTGDPLDCAQVERIQDLPDINVLGLQTDNHNITEELKRQGLLSSLVEAFIMADELNSVSATLGVTYQ